ncbi:MAG TPA: hypothetical protein VEG27_14715 [Usitatibacter sp.]|nr:hypothetical protein [Usitatibacter sp.]
MKQIIGCPLGHIACASMMSLVLVACATGNEPPPIGSGTGSASPASYPVDVEKTSVSFLGSPEAQSRDGIEVKLDLSSNSPKLYYRYDVTSRVNGKYLLFMPGAPKIYSVYRIPFYKADSDASVVSVTLTNSSPRVLDTSRAVCEFDLDGQAVVTVPLKTGALLPEHSSAVQVMGPTMSQLKGHKEMTIWIYQIGATEAGRGEIPFKWTLPYTLTVTSGTEEARLIGESPTESKVKRYEGLVEPAGSEALIEPAGSQARIEPTGSVTGSSLLRPSK